MELDRRKRNDSTIRLQSEYAVGDSITTKRKGTRVISEIRDMDDIRYVYSTVR
jgi:hypothetical protein